ncbi:M48 family metalloprotease [Tsukamurella asaccharolytica]|uniref:M48 family metalloprotease n=1 Tax=Tsukamurella asaccharolytica TaxID=2592067 RepID=A0A5C5R6R6_9ACTN|nr:M48 family metalloprotease [Tsukamurella asaccharolytica]
MDDSTEQTPGREPRGDSSPTESARSGAFSSEPDESTLPSTGFFPVVQPDEPAATSAAPSDASTSAFPSTDFPTDQYRAGGQALPELGAHDPSVTAGLGAPVAQSGGPVSGPGYVPGGAVPGGHFPPGGPFAPAPQAPAYAGAPRRHPWEIPLLVIVILVTILIYGGALVLAAIGVVNEYLLLALVVPILLWFGRGLTWAAPRVQGVQMTPTQFPEGYRMVREAAARYGMREVPDAFVVIGNGQINAFASGHGFRRFVVVYSDLFEIGGEARDPDALAYIIGHEVGHIAAGHVSYWRQVGSFAMSYLPVIGAALSRSQEYTADNYGYFNQPSGSPGGMGVLGAGKYLGKQVDFNQLADRASTDKGFFTWLVNLTASHPVLTWRAAALRNRTKAGSLWFAPSGPVRGIGGGAVVPAGPVPTYTKQEVLAPAPGQAPPAPVASGHLHHVPTAQSQPAQGQPARNQPYPEGGYFAQWQQSQGHAAAQPEQGSDDKPGQPGTRQNGPSGS